jgi:hypothetical protein
VSYPVVVLSYADAWYDDALNLPPDIWPTEWAVSLSGFLVRDTPTVISIAQELHPDGSLGAVTHVMRRMVRSLEVVREGES